ncbi:NAD-dependent epimerase/dehydratase family protein [Allokutzneria albata]|uniref:Nucleoside-diphosphate-sugar epimerase n=1 Tax=Allokutzneria albata TaxID=211114 RepID=A0A1G9RW27_ALLAB|nr:NAD-dependent epimerase/dehydratase family protein [Allokutzneria albata]SDM27431.1 Nucleoside-diphosphate-sugar epimerase [Allokutzneria albata]
MKIVITGASGNIGTGLLRRLAEGGQRHEIVGVCRRPPPPSAPPYHIARWEAVDLTAPERLSEVFEGADAVVHLAWAVQPIRDEDWLHAVNVEGSRAVFEAARRAGVPHVVYASSVGVYAPSALPVDESSPTTGVPSSVYSRHKVAVEQELRGFGDLDVAVIRPTLITQRVASAGIAALYLRPLVTPLLLRLGRSKAVPVLPIPSGLKLRLVHADDVADAIIAILDKRATGAFNLAAEDTLDRAALADAMHAKAIPVPDFLAKAAVAVLWRARVIGTSPGWFDLAAVSPLLDASRARRELGFAPKHSSADCAREQVEGLCAGVRGTSPALSADRLGGSGEQVDRSTVDVGPRRDYRGLRRFALAAGGVVLAGMLGRSRRAG